MSTSTSSDKPTHERDPPTPPEQWQQRTKAFFVRRVPGPVWLICILGGFYLLLATLGTTRNSYAPTPFDDDNDDYIVTGVEQNEFGIVDHTARLCIHTIKWTISLHADDPDSIQWLFFARLTNDDIPGVMPNRQWLVRYRARNTYNALELFQQGVTFKVRTNKDGNEETDWFRIDSIQRVPVNRF